jgi:hypothetical protein
MRGTGVRVPHLHHSRRSVTCGFSCLDHGRVALGPHSVGLRRPNKRAWTSWRRWARESSSSGYRRRPASSLRRPRRFGAAAAAVAMPQPSVLAVEGSSIRGLAGGFDTFGSAGLLEDRGRRFMWVGCTIWCRPAAAEVTAAKRVPPNARTRSLSPTSPEPRRRFGSGRRFGRACPAWPRLVMQPLRAGPELIDPVRGASIGVACSRWGSGAARGATDGREVRDLWPGVQDEQRTRLAHPRGAHAARDGAATRGR